MIGKFILGTSFSGLVNYLISDKKHKGNDLLSKPMAGRAEILGYNNIYGDKDDLIRQFTEVSLLNRHQSKPVLHLSLSFAKSDPITTDLIFKIVDELAKDFNFVDNQYLIIRHHDTAETHGHVHLCINRVNLSGKTNVSDSHSYKRTSDFCRKIETKYDLQAVMAPRRFLPKNQRLIPRKDNRKLKLKALVKEAVAKAKSIEDLSLRLADKGIKTIKGRGLSFVDNKSMKIKGSEIGYSLAKVEKQIKVNLNPEKRPIVHDLKQRIRKISR